jgi:hypothetical protein
VALTPGDGVPGGGSPQRSSRGDRISFVHAAITAATGFLVAVLWFDLMFDVLVWPHRGADEVPESVLTSISTYYRRVTTDAHPMGRLVALVMVVLLGLLVWQATTDDVAGWVTVVSLAAAFTAIGLAIGRVVPAAVRLGSAQDPTPVRSRLARQIFREHLLFIGLMLTVLIVQLVGGR